MRTRQVSKERTQSLKPSSTNTKQKLSCAITAILSGSSAGFLYAGPAGDSIDSIQEITVTAQRRTENMQDVPISIQALTAETLTQLNVSTFDDFVKYLPNVSVASVGPGQGSVYMRGLSVGVGGPQGSGITSFPNVAIYLDEQSGQLPSRNLDIYAVDMERIEVLEGPQGTLFGAGAQAGVLRYITNKPKLDAFEGNVDAGGAFTAHGAPSKNVDATINVPLIPDTLAVRAVVYSDWRGGYINNIPGTFTRSDTDPSIVRYFNDVVPPGSPSINNSNMLANDINPVKYEGFRIAGLYKISDDWNVLLTEAYQNMNAEGVFFETPVSTAGQVLPDLSVQQYNPSFDKDRFESTALTATGHIGALKLIYAGSYLVRNVEQTQDYTNYARLNAYGSYYECVGGGATSAPVPMCFTPKSSWHDTEKNTHQSHEIRLSTPDDWRLRGLMGIYYESDVIHEQTDWLYRTAPGFVNIGPPPGATTNNPNTRPSNEAFFDDIDNGYTQQAAFLSIDYDIIPKTLTATLGTRYYDMNAFELGSAVSSFGCRAGGAYTTGIPTEPCTVGATNLNAENLNKTYVGFKSRGNLSWKVTADALLYYTWSQGFRPGGFNRNSTCHLPVNGVNTYCTPISYAPDTLTNNEVGWKTEWWDHRVQFNGAIYQENWNNIQVQFFDPLGDLGNLSFAVNGPNYRVRGVETQVVARVTHELTLIGGASWNSSNQTNSPYLIGVSGQPITSIPNPYGAEGSSLAQSPPFQANLRARYEFKVGEYDAFWQVGATHQAHSYSATGYVQVYDQPGFTTYDGSFGVGNGPWAAQLYGQNLSDKRADMFTCVCEGIKGVTVNRPRTVGVKASYKF